MALKQGIYPPIAAGDVDVNALAGSGLTASGDTLNVGAGSGVTVSADAVAVDTTVARRNVSNTFTADQTIDATLNFGTLGDANLVRATTGVLSTNARFRTTVGIDILTDGGTGIRFGASFDTNLYRSAANTLATDDGLHVKPTVGTAVSIDSRAAAVLASPTGTTQNAFVVKAPSSSWVDVNYGEAQAFMLLRDDNNAGENLYGTPNVEPDRNVLWRVDGKTGATGMCNGIHVAVGLRQHAGFTATYGMHLAAKIDVAGVISQSHAEDSVGNHFIGETLSGKVTFLVTPSGTVGSWSRSTTEPAGYSWGRNGLSSGNEGQLVTSGGAGQFLATDAAGDLVLKHTSASGSLLFGAGTTALMAMASSGVFTAVGMTVGGALNVNLGAASGQTIRSGAAGNYAYIDIGRTGTDAQLAVAAGAGQFVNGTVAGDVVLKNNATAGKLFLGVGGTGANEIVISDGAVDINGDLSITGTLRTASGSASSLALGTVVEFTEQTDPGAPAVNKGRLYIRDNGAGKSQLCIRFNTGAIGVLYTQP